MSAIYLVNASGVLNGPVTFPVVPGVGVQTPDNALQLAETLPSCPDGFAWGLVDDEPMQLKDHRGPVYSTATGARQEWSALGELSEGVTTIPFPGPFHVWDVNAWRLDTGSQTAAKAAEVLAERDDRLRASQVRIAPLQYAHEIGDPSEQEKVALSEWKRYSVDLNRIEQQDGFPLTITWPVVPA